MDTSRWPATESATPVDRADRMAIGLVLFESVLLLYSSMSIWYFFS